MSELFDKSIRTLELPAVLELLAAQAVSDEARDRCRKLRPDGPSRRRLERHNQIPAPAVRAYH